MCGKYITNFFRAIIILLVLAAIGACGSGSPSAPAHTNTAAIVPTNQPTIVYKMGGVNFSLYLDKGIPITDSLIERQINIIAPYTQSIKTFTTTDGMANAGLIAHNHGVKAAIGAWIGSTSVIPNNNDKEVNNLITLANAGQVDIAVVGGEVMWRGDISETELIGYLNKVRVSIPAHIPVTTAMSYSEIVLHPAVADACDVILLGYYPYFDGRDIHQAVYYLNRLYHWVEALYPGKKIIIGETGWPGVGNTIGMAVPSPQNAAFYFLNFVSWAKANNVEYFYFEALDEPGKTSAACEASLGIWEYDTVTGTSSLKPGMRQVFDGVTTPDNWTTLPVI